MALPEDFAGSNITITPGKGTEDRVAPLHAFRATNGETISRWKLSPAEIAHVVATGEVWASQQTFGHPLQPLMISGLPLMALVDENGDPAGVYDPDDKSISGGDLRALGVFQVPNAV